MLLGVVPHFADAGRLPAEDAGARRGSVEGRRRAGSPCCGCRASPGFFDDLDLLRAEPGGGDDRRAGEGAAGDCDLVLLPGSKSTTIAGHLEALRRASWDVDYSGASPSRRVGARPLRRFPDARAKHRRPAGSRAGRGIAAAWAARHRDGARLDKATRPVAGRHLGSGEAVSGYDPPRRRSEGLTRACSSKSAAALMAPCPRMVLSPAPTHGLFAGDGFRRAFLAGLGALLGAAYEAGGRAVLDGLARTWPPISTWKRSWLAARAEA